MKYLLFVAACLLGLVSLTSSASRKEDLERAAELAVERAAERAAERAVEKLLEAGNFTSHNTTTETKTVNESYENTRLAPPPRKEIVEDQNSSTQVPADAPASTSPPPATPLPVPVTTTPKPIPKESEESTERSRHSSSSSTSERSRHSGSSATSGKNRHSNSSTTSERSRHSGTSTTPEAKMPPLPVARSPDGFIDVPRTSHRHRHSSSEERFPPTGPRLDSFLDSQEKHHHRQHQKQKHQQALLIAMRPPSPRPFTNIEIDVGPIGSRPSPSIYQRIPPLPIIPRLRRFDEKRFSGNLGTMFGESDLLTGIGSE